MTHLTALLVTDPGVVMGTASYMSPEQARDGKQMALARGTQTGDVLMITDFK